MHEQREHSRHPARWPCTIVLDAQPGTVYHGRTHDLSECGAAVLTDHNLSTSSPFTLTLSVPPTNVRGQPLMLEFRCRMAYSVHSDRHCCFRHGVHFVGFKGAAKVQLQRVLSQHFLPGAEKYAG
ncbi:MAG TPA: PilZ domain-containing protein [Azospira sp.]|nr:PilZ domain-containing protein [Azospira sp.]